MNPSLAAMFALAALMILLPLFLWRWGVRRFDLGRHGWATIGFGSLFFILSQIVETPLRFGVAQSGLAAGLLGAWLLSTIAGLGEESMRYVAMRWVAQIRERLDRPTAIVYGLGHGGFESLALGLGVLVTALLIRNAGDPASAGTLSQGLADQARQVAETPPYVFASGVVERTLAIVLHVGLSLVVRQAVVRRAPVFLVAAIALHAIVNGVALTLQSGLQNVVVTELWVALAAAGVLAYGLTMREADVSAAGRS